MIKKYLLHPQTSEAPLWIPMIINLCREILPVEIHSPALQSNTSTHTSRLSLSSRSFILKNTDDGALGDTVFIFHQGPWTHMQICLP